MKNIQRKKHYQSMGSIDTFTNLVSSIESRNNLTRFIWRKNTYWLHRIVEDPGNHVLHYFQDVPDRAFVCKELMYIPEDSQVLPDWLSQ